MESSSIQLSISSSSTNSAPKFKSGRSIDPFLYQSHKIEGHQGNQDHPRPVPNHQMVINPIQTETNSNFQPHPVVASLPKDLNKAHFVPQIYPPKD